MSIVVKKDKKKVSYFIYISLFAFLLVVVWFFYSKWLAEQEVLKKTKKTTLIDVTEGLADIKADEADKLLNDESYSALSEPATFFAPQVKGKTNLFSSF